MLDFSSEFVESEENASKGGNSPPWLNFQAWLKQQVETSRFLSSLKALNDPKVLIGCGSATIVKYSSTKKGKASVI